MDYLILSVRRGAVFVCFVFTDNEKQIFVIHGQRANYLFPTDSKKVMFGPILRKSTECHNLKP